VTCSGVCVHTDIKGTCVGVEGVHLGRGEGLPSWMFDLYPWVCCMPSLSEGVESDSAGVGDWASKATA
jgi:hypothetical protein